jgi:hypothetical protein
MAYQQTALNCFGIQNNEGKRMFEVFGNTSNIEREKRQQKLISRNRKYWSKQFRRFAMPQSFVKFNVGGEIFQTSLETVLSEPDTLFHLMFNGSWKPVTDVDGAIFLDRDPR